MKIFFQSPKWGATTVFRQSLDFTGICSSSKWTPFAEEDCDWFYCSEISKLPTNLQDKCKSKRIFIMQENPNIWKPTKDFLEQYGVIISPYLLDVPSSTHFIQSQPAVPWFYGIKFDTTCGLLHKPLGGALELGSLKNAEHKTKSKLLSVISSNKGYLPGHQWRIMITNALLEEFSTDIDVYGFGHKPISDKSEALDNYQFSIVIENESSPHYWTEKLSDCLLAETIPIYAGASLASHYFEMNIPCIPFGCEPSQAISLIKYYLSHCTLTRAEITKARNKVLDDFNILEYLPKLLT